MNSNFKKILIGIVVVLLIFVAYRGIFGADEITVDESAQAKKIQEYAHPESFITAPQLKKLMDENDDVVVIGSLNPKKGDSPIAGSFTMWRPDYSAAEDAYPYGGMRNTTEEMEEILSNFGATQDSTIVVYAANRHHDAARLWWQIKLLGHEDVRYLDGGLNVWLGEGYETGNANPDVEKTDYTAPNASTELLATQEDVIAALENGTVIDTRTPEEVSGEKTKGGAAGPGKIDGSVHINWTNTIAEDTTLKSLSDLEEIYKDVEDKNVISFCQSGVRSSHTLLVLTQALGYENVKNYDGSWIEWSYDYYENGSDIPTANTK